MTGQECSLCVLCQWLLFTEREMSGDLETDFLLQSPLQVDIMVNHPSQEREAIVGLEISHRLLTLHFNRSGPDLGGHQKQNGNNKNNEFPNPLSTGWL